MTRKISVRISEGLRQAIAFAESDGKKPGYRVHAPETIDVKAIRQRTNLSQEAFARWFGIAAPTLRHWERGDRHPQGPARVLLTLIEHAPEMVLETLQKAQKARVR